MKYLIFVFVVVVLAFSCKKNDYFIQKEDSHEWCGTTFEEYYFQGKIKDTSNGNSLIGHTLSSRYSSPYSKNSTDTISDSSYYISFRGIYLTDSADNHKNNQIYIRNSANILVDSFIIPISNWILFDTATYDYSF